MTDKLGILAGGGDLPRLLVDQCLAEGRPFFVILFENQADPDDFSDVPHAVVRLGAVGKSLKVLRENAVSTLVLAGKVRRPSLSELRPDSVAMKFLLKTGAKSLGDDGLLRAVVSFLEEEHGFNVIGSDSLIATSTQSCGPLGALKADETAASDIERGRDVLRIMGPADVGQAIVVQDGLVLGVEAIEGTEALLRRCAELKRPGPGGVLVKLRKPKQETRVDLPTIGPETVQQAADAGLRGIAFDAGGMVVLRQDEVIAEADRLGVFIEAVAPLPEDD